MLLVVDLALWLHLSRYRYACINGALDTAIWLWLNCQLPPCSQPQHPADQAIETAASMSCSYIVGAERAPIASLQSAAQRQHTVNTSRVTKCLFDAVPTYQLPYHGRKSWEMHTYGNRYIFLIDSLLPAYTIVLCTPLAVDSDPHRLLPMAVSTCSFDD
jgi:hypothetical protein